MDDLSFQRVVMALLKSFREHELILRYHERAIESP